MKALILNRFPFKVLEYYLNQLDPSLTKDLLLITSEQSLQGEQSESRVFLQRFREVWVARDYDTSGHVERLAFQAFSLHRFESLIALSEYDLLRAAHLREALGVAGQSVQSSLAFRDKWEMRELAAAVVRTPAQMKVDNFSDIFRAKQKWGFPFVLKPRTGAGSSGVEILSSDGELETWLDTHPELRTARGLELLAEEFVAGEMYQVDGIAANSELLTAWPSRYWQGCLAYRQSLPQGSCALESSNPLALRLVEKTREVLKALPHDTRSAIHAEFFVTPDEQIVLCEIASRAGGADTTSSLLETLGVDLEQEFLRLQLGGPLQAYEQRPKEGVFGWFIFPPKKGTLVQVADRCPLEGVTRFDVYAAAGSQFDGAQTSVDGIAGGVLKASSEKQWVDRAVGLGKWFEASTVWSGKEVAHV